MNLFNMILRSIGMVLLLPTVFLIPAVIITAIIGAVKNNFTYLKTYLKIWAGSFLGFLVILFVYGMILYFINR